MDQSGQHHPTATTPTVGVAVVAGGASRRMQGRDKLFIPILARPLLLYCLKSFQNSSCVDRIAIAASPASIARVHDLAVKHEISKVVSVVPGGARRQDSVANALKALGDVGVVMVHDAARPFVDNAIIEMAVGAAREFRAAAAAVPVKDTIKIAFPDMTIASTPPRDTLWAAQTPQSFDLKLLLDAHSRITDDVTDDAAMVEMLGLPVKLFMGSHDNIKVTTPEDIPVAEAIAKARLGTPIT